SRGGVVALLVGLSVLFLFRPSRGSSSFAGWLVPLALILARSVALVGWIGLGAVQSRLAKLPGEADARGSPPRLWSDSLHLLREFPIWGTGYGTFQFAEPIHRSSAQDIIYEHAENDYLEGLVEGGAMGLLLMVLAIGLVYRLGY